MTDRRTRKSPGKTAGKSGAAPARGKRASGPKRPSSSRAQRVEKNQETHQAKSQSKGTQRRPTPQRTKSEPPAVDTAQESAGTGERLQKVLAQAGMGSRRDMERWISAGRVTVNGEVAELGQRVMRSDRVQVDGGKPLRSMASNHRVLLMNKNEGVVCTRRDPEGRPTVFRGLPRLKTGRWISVGRLDINTSGLLLLCTDGELANRLMHPSTGLDREYAVRVNGQLEDEAVARLLAGVIIDGEKHSFSDIRYFNGSGRNHWYHVVLMEGKNREVRRLFESEGLQVSRLKRVRYGPVMLPPWLPRGQQAEMNADDLRTLYGLLGLTLRLPRGSSKPIGNSEREKKRQRSVLLPYPSLGGHAAGASGEPD